MLSVLTKNRFLGRTLWQRQFGALSMTLTRYGPSERLPPHQHQNPYLCVVLGGGFRECSQHREDACRTGTVILNLSDAWHDDHFGGDGGLCLNIDLDQPCLRILDGVQRAGPAYHRTPFTCTHAQRVRWELSEKDGLSPLMIHGLVLELLVEAARATMQSPGVAPAWLSQVKAEIHKRFARGVTLHTLAALAGVHPAHLARTFRQHYGTTVGEYSRRLRVAHAHRLIEAGVSLAEASQACGFSDQSHLTRTFRQVLGATPASARVKSDPRNSHSNAQT